VAIISNIWLTNPRFYTASIVKPKPGRIQARNGGPAKQGRSLALAMEGSAGGQPGWDVRALKTVANQGTLQPQAAV